MTLLSRSDPESMGKTLNVFLYNPISGQGHLDSYARLYAEACLRLGHRVVLISKDCAGISEYLTGVLPLHQMTEFFWLSFEKLDNPIAATQPAASYRLSFQRIIKTMLRRIRSICLMFIKLIYHYVSLFAPTYCDFVRRPSDPNYGRIKYSLIADRLCRACEIANLSPDVLFILYLDLMTHDLREIELFDKSLECGWAGILFHPVLPSANYVPPEQLFASSMLKGLIYLMPSSVNFYRELFPHLHFTLAPDVAVTETHDSTTLLERKLLSLAGPRKIVLMIGALGAYKGVIRFLQLIAAAQHDNLFFALVGEVSWSSFDSEEQCIIRSFYQNPPENVFLHDSYLEDERVYNSLIRASSVIYAVYKTSSGSANSLTKSAFFRRPILVSNQSYIGELVKDAGIGLAVPPDDLNEIYRGVTTLVQDRLSDANYARFSERNSMSMLELALESALAKWCN